jgi:putative tricarboxylic transport membrane protein
MLLFGVLGYLMRKFNYEGAPLVLAFVLGPLIEQSLRQSLLLSQGSFLIFVSRPISAVTLAIGCLALISKTLPFFKQWRKRYDKMEPEE